MHGLLLATVLTIAIVLRITWQPTPSRSWQYRWFWACCTFLLPPLLLLSSAIALLWMGPEGEMVRHWEGIVTYSWAVGFISIAIVLGGKLLCEAQQTLWQIRQQPRCKVQDCSAHLLKTPMPFIAQIGFWHPQLVVSQGLLEILDETHLQAVLQHEQAHDYFHDTFWFFWFGWLRRLTAWLPNTEVLWQELLLLREIRADRWAIQTVDPLFLAEALLALVLAPPMTEEITQLSFVASLNMNSLRDRFSERIDAMLESEAIDRSVLGAVAPNLLGWQPWYLCGMALLPLLVIPFHH
jgi:Zn-dependent protease with chaperone function